MLTYTINYPPFLLIQRFYCDVFTQTLNFKVLRCSRLRDEKKNPSLSSIITLITSGILQFIYFSLTMLVFLCDVISSDAINVEAFH